MLQWVRPLAAPGMYAAQREESIQLLLTMVLHGALAAGCRKEKGRDHPAFLSASCRKSSSRSAHCCMSEVRSVR